MKKFALLTILLLIAGCISVPIPPVGDKSGDYGKIQISLAVKYIQPDKQIDWFNPIMPQPKLYKDK